MEEIKDPETGEVLGVERPKIAILTVTEVSDEFCKAQIAGELEIELEVGDEVETGSEPFVVAVCPIYHENGSLTNVGAKLGEDITTVLVQRSVPVVERTVLDTVLPELLAQNTILFDEESAQELGRLSGASVVVTGKIVPDRRTGTAYIRMVDVETGEILIATSDSISLATARVIDGTAGAARTPGTPRRTGPAVRLAGDAPRNWRLVPARRGAQIWTDDTYALRLVPRDLNGSNLLVRGKGTALEWLPPGLTAVRPVTVFAVVRWKYLGATLVDDLMVEEFEQDGWKKLRFPLQTTTRSGENWGWMVLETEVPEGDILLTLESVQWDERIPVLFFFK